MAVRFRRSFRVVPGVRLNLSIRASRGSNVAAPDPSDADAGKRTEQHPRKAEAPQSEEQRLELFRAVLFIAALLGIVGVIAHFYFGK